MNTIILKKTSTIRVNMEKEHWYIVTTGVLSGTIVFGGQLLVNLGLSFFQIAIFPLLFTLLLLPIVILKKECRIKRGMLKTLMAYGFISTFAAYAEFMPIVLGVPVAIIVLLLYTQPLWTIILSKWFLGEIITKRKIIAMVTVLIGALILINPFNISKVGNILGVIIALLGGISLSGWVIMGRVSGKKKFHPITTKFGYTMFLVLFLFLSYPLMQMFVKDPAIINIGFNLPINIWMYLLIFALVSNLIPHLFYFAGTRKVESSDAGIILLLEPVSAAVLAAVFLGQAITLNIFVGGLFILFANYLVVKK